jgi:hypothetical protein
LLKPTIFKACRTLSPCSVCVHSSILVARDSLPRPLASLAFFHLMLLKALTSHSFQPKLGLRLAIQGWTCLKHIAAHFCRFSLKQAGNFGICGFCRSQDGSVRGRACCGRRGTRAILAWVAAAVSATKLEAKPCGRQQALHSWKLDVCQALCIHPSFSTSHLPPLVGSASFWCHCIRSRACWCVSSTGTAERKRRRRCFCGAKETYV